MACACNARTNHFSFYFLFTVVKRLFDSLNREQIFYLLSVYLCESVKCGVKGVVVAGVEMVKHFIEALTNLTKSKRCPKTLDTQGFLSILHFHRFFRFLPFFGAKTFDVDSIAQKYEKSNSSFRPTKHIGKMLNKVTNKFFNSFLFYGIISSINKNLPHISFFRKSRYYGI